MNRYRKCLPNLCMLIAIVFCLAAGQQAHAQESTASVFTSRKDFKNLVLPIEDDAFQFAIYGDRTSGVPAGLKVLRQAVNDTNVIGPDLVMTVGDLVQGYNKTDQWLQEKDEYKEIMNRLNCRWYPVAGNHDVYWDQKDNGAPAGQHESNYEKHFGPLWYSFEYKNSGFLVLYSDEGDPETNRKGFRDGLLQTMSDQQLEFLQQALKQLADCEHIFVFLHHPRWIGGGYEGGNWETVHDTMKKAGNVSAVFAGHIHHMRFDGVRDGIQYYALATTGGSLSADFPDAGYLHHFNLVTVRKDKVHVATLPVGTVVDPKKFTQEYLTQLHESQQMQAKQTGKRLPLSADGSCLGEYEVEFTNPSDKNDLETEIFVQLTGRWQAYPTHCHLKIPKGETVKTKFKFMRELNSPLFDSDADGSKLTVPSLAVQSFLLMDEVRVQLPPTEHELQLTLAAEHAVAAENRCLTLADVGSKIAQGLPVFDDRFELPQGPFTLEAWVKPSSNDRSRGIVAKTQSSEYALFSHEGVASFDVHLNGKYASAKSKQKLPLNHWTHVAGVYDGTQLRLYLNGKLVDTTEASGTRTLNRLPLYIGADPDGKGKAVRAFAGQIDEVRLSTGAIYDEEFQPATRLSKTDDTVLLLNLDSSFQNLYYESGQEQLCTPVGNLQLLERN